MKIVRYYPRAVVGDGGITNSVWCHSQELVRDGVRVVIAYDEGAPPETDGIEWRAVRHVGRPWRLPLRAGPILDDADLVVLHSGWTLHNVYVGWRARRRGVPYLLEPRGAYDPSILRRRRRLKRAWWWLWERRLVHGARAVHIFFDDERSHLEALGYRGEVVVAPNGIEVRDECRWDGGSGGYVLWYGRFDPEHKGLDLLLRALRLLPASERPPLRLHGPDARIGGKDEVRRLARELGIEAWVTIDGAVYGREKYDLLRRAVGFVYPSRWEAFGNAVAEAATAGVPTLTTTYPLGKYLAAHGGAVVVEPTPVALAGGLRALVAPGAAEIGARAREVIRGLTWDHVAQDWLDQVNELL